MSLTCPANGHRPNIQQMGGGLMARRTTRRTGNLDGSKSRSPTSWRPSPRRRARAPTRIPPIPRASRQRNTEKTSGKGEALSLSRLRAAARRGSRERARRKPPALLPPSARGGGPQGRRGENLRSPKPTRYKPPRRTSMESKRTCHSSGACAGRKGRQRPHSGRGEPDHRHRIFRHCHGYVHHPCRHWPMRPSSS